MGNFDANIKVTLDGLGDLEKAQGILDKLKATKVKIDIDDGALKGLQNIGKMKIGTVKIKTELDNSNLQAKINSMGKTLNLSKTNIAPKIDSAGVTKFNGDLNKLQVTATKVQGTISKPLKPDTSGVDKAKKSMEQYGKSSEKVSKQVAKVFDPNKGVTASNNTLNWLNKNSKAMKEYGTRLKEIAELQKKATSQEELTGLNNEFKAIQSQARLEGLTGKGGLFGGLAGSLGKMAIQAVTLQKALSVVKSLATEVKAIDSSMTELRKVSSAPSLEIDNYFKTASASAKELGASISDVIATTADWSRMGYGLKDASKLSDVTTLFQKVGDNMTQESASTALISTLKGFQMKADESGKIVDIINAVSNTQPIDSAGISEALSRSASSMSAANNSLAETVGLITAANSVVNIMPPYTAMYRKKVA